MDLAGQVCLVTGAGRGIGRAHARLLATQGARVVVNDVTGESGHNPADDVVEEIHASGGEAVAAAGSVADWNEARRIVQTAVDAFGDLDVLVNNAAVVRGWSLLDLEENDIDLVLDVGLKGVIVMTRWAAQHWQDRSKGGDTHPRAVVNTTSGAGLHGTAGQAHYAGAKAGVAAVTLVSARELAPLSVRVNAIAPIAKTKSAEQVPGTAGMLDAPAFDPDNVAPIVAALASRRCTLTGQVFSVVGGSVGRYAGWSLAEQLAAPGERWDPDLLIDELAALPETVSAPTQREVIQAVLQGAAAAD